jgi:hypothetical protein
MAIRRKPRLYKVIWNKDGNQDYNLIAAISESDSLNRIEQLLGIKKAFITDIQEINCGYSNLLISTNIVDNILQVGAKRYVQHMHGQDSYLYEDNLKAIKNTATKLKK